MTIAEFSTLAERFAKHCTYKDLDTAKNDLIQI